MPTVGKKFRTVFVSHPPARAFEGVRGKEHLQQFVALHDSGAVNGNFQSVSLRGRATGDCGRGRRAVADCARVG